MAKKVKQFRFYSNTSTQNYGGVSYNNLISGSAFSQYMPILQLGIQSLPGTKFYLNGSNNPIIIGTTGIYEIDLQGLTEINALQFDPGSINIINNNANAYLIVDIIYDGGGVS